MFSSHPKHKIHHQPLQKWESDDGFRYYKTPEGLIYPSVTSFLGDNEEKERGLEEWRNRIGHEEADRITKHSALRGEQYHQAIEKYLKNERIPDKGCIPDAKFMFKKVKKELNRIDNIVAQEVSLYSNTLQLAGTVDCIAEYDGVLSSIDFKTSRKPKKLEWIQDYIFQTLIYSIMVEELHGLTVPRLVVIMVDEQSSFGYSFVIDDRKKYLRDMLKQLKQFQENRHNGK